MDELSAKIEPLLQEECELNERIATCEAYIATLLDYTSKKGSGFHLLTVEDILCSIHNYSMKLQIELLHTQFEQAIAHCRVKGNESV